MTERRVPLLLFASALWLVGNLPRALAGGDAEILLVALLGVAAGVLGSTAGFGTGSLLLPAFLWRLQLEEAILALTIPHLSASLSRLWRTRFEVDLAVMLRLGAAGAVGAALGTTWTGSGAGHELMPWMALVSVAAVAGSAASHAVEAPRDSPVLRWTGALVSGTSAAFTGTQGVIRSSILRRVGESHVSVVATSAGAAVLCDGARLVVGGSEVTRAIASLEPAVSAATFGVLLGDLLGSRCEDPTAGRLPRAIASVAAIVATAAAALVTWGRPT